MWFSFNFNSFVNNKKFHGIELLNYISYIEQKKNQKLQICLNLITMNFKKKIKHLENERKKDNSVNNDHS